MEFSYDQYDDNIVLVGLPKSGKTHALKRLIIPSLRGSAWIWYPEQRDDRLPDFVKSQGWQVASSIDQLKLGRALIYPRDRSIEEFDRFCERADALSNLTLVVDEAEYYVGKYKIKSPSFARIVNGGRPRGVCWVAIARRPQQLHNDILHAANHVFCFAFDLPGDLEFMSHWVGPEVWGFVSPEKRKTAFRTLPQLPQHAFVYYNKDTNYRAVGVLPK
ncbi:MAG: hypothetical protein JRN62_10095 [Nitrososphaerota archaeon]|jgi:hypothetical protein|nr:hypothetical protein [Nitrososphaerota archaeon]MDG6949815.1 hypothetical protein [Nitrososphaerota archaeon]